MENLKEQSSPIRVKRNKFIEETKREQQNSQLNFQFKNVSPRLAQKEIDEAILDLHKQRSSNQNPYNQQWSKESRNPINVQSSKYGVPHIR